MALETGTYISDLVTTNPPNTDGVSQADDHLRLIKSTVKATFPNITGPVTLTQAQLNAAARTNAANSFTATQSITGPAAGTSLTLSDATNSTLNIKHESGGLVTYESTYAEIQRWNTGGSERMRLDNSGNVGIGTTSSLGTYGKLRVAGTGYQALNVGSDDASGVNVIVAANSTTEGRIGTVTNHPVDFYSNGSARMRIDASGNVGIGTSSPSSYGKLAVLDGDVYAGKTTGITSLAANSSSVTASLSANSAGVGTVGTQTNHAFWFMTNNTQRMAIDAAGAVTIGGNPVISASGTAAQGDVLYHNGTAWTRLPAGTSGQVLKTNGAGANPSWVTPTVGGMTLLATLATTSGASVPSGTLNLTPYRKLFISFVGISAANSSAVLSLNGVTIITLGTAPATQNLWVELDLNSGIGYRCAASGITGDAYGIINGTTSFSVAVASTTFDAGSIQIYGIA